MAIQKFEHITAPEGTIDTMRELVEEAVKAIEALPPADIKPLFYRIARVVWWNELGKPFLDKARAALEGEEGEKG